MISGNLISFFCSKPVLKCFSWHKIIKRDLVVKQVTVNQFITGSSSNKVVANKNWYTLCIYWNKW